MTNKEHASLRAIVRGTIENMIGSGVAVEVDRLVSKLLCKYEVSGRDSQVAIECIRYTLRDLATREMRRYDRESAEDDERVQLSFKGYSLQPGYAVIREGVSMLVPTDLLTDREIDEKIAGYESMAAGCIAHADEFRRYKRARSSGAQVA